jgi:glycosyltransferase involved in cell wall biosynthesis
MNLRAHSAKDARIRPEYRNVSGWVSNGWLERMPVLPAGVRGRIRATLEAAPIAGWPRPDVIWTSALEQLAPYLWSQLGPLYRPLVMDWDARPGYLEGNAQLFFGRPAHGGVRLAVDNLRRAAVWKGVTRFAAWSSWAASGLERSGVLPERIRVLPPGVDLDAWRPVTHARGQKIRLLFVGADFERKGGGMLLDVLGSRRDYFELDIVTRSEIGKASWYRVHRAEPNSPLLRRLYAEADLFVFPTRAECFGIAALEAMASGLPVVIGDVGAAREIVDDGVTGFVVRPEPEDLAAALDSIARNPDQMQGMGRRARAVAEVRFDGNRNDRRLVDLLLEEHDRFKGPMATTRRLEKSLGD